MQGLKIDCQEIVDYKILYDMFGDEEYKRQYEKIHIEMLLSIFNISGAYGKWLMLSNIKEDKGLDGIFNYYHTVVKVEKDSKETLFKIIDLLESLGEMEWIEIFDKSMDIKLKDGYLLTMHDFTHGVI